MLSFFSFLKDLRTNDCRATYSSLSDGNLTRTHNLFAGKLEPAFCIAHCGCLSKSYAALDSLGFCFCGNTQGTACSGQKDCSRVSSSPLFCWFVANFHDNSGCFWLRWSGNERLELITETPSQIGKLTRKTEALFAERKGSMESFGCKEALPCLPMWTNYF